MFLFRAISLLAILVVLPPLRAGEPNALIDLSESFLNAFVDRSVDRTEPVKDYILGTSIRGTGRTIARTSVELIPDETRASVNLLVRGDTFANSVGRRKPVCLYSDATFCFEVRMRVGMEERGLSAGRPWSKAKGQTQLNELTTDYHGLLDRIVKPIALRQYRRNKEEGLAISEQHAEEKYVEGMERDVGRELQKGQGDFERMVARIRQQVALESYRFRSTADYVGVVAVVHTGASPTSPPERSAAAELQGRVHESVVEQAVAKDLRGKTYTDKDPPSRLPEFVRRAVQQEKAKQAKEEVSWSITLDDKQPVTLRFHDDRVTTTIRIREFVNDGEKYAGMNLTSRYRLQQTAEGYDVVREGELEILPPGFVPGGGKKLTARQVGQIRVLKDRVGAMFPERVTLPDVQPPPAVQHLGPLKLTVAKTQAGWLHVGWWRRYGINPEGTRTCGTRPSVTINTDQTEED